MEAFVCNYSCLGDSSLYGDNVSTSWSLDTNILAVKHCIGEERGSVYSLPHSPTTSKLSLLGCPQSKSSPFFRATSNTLESSWLILSIFTEQSPSAIRPKRDVRPWKSLLTWSLSSLLKAVLRRGNRWPPPLNLSRTSTLCFLPLLGWGAGGVKEQGITTQEPTRAWTRSGTEGTGETAWTSLHKAAAVMQNRENTHDLMQYGSFWVQG